MTRPKRVFVVGCRRSGTTWTMLMLARHRRVVALQQVDFFRRLAHFGRWYDGEQPFGTCALTTHVLPERVESAPENGLYRVSVRGAQSGSPWRELARPLVDDAYARFAALNPEALVVVDQTPEYVRVWEDVLASCPDAWFVHVIRDPRSVFASHQNAARSWADATRFSYAACDVAREWAHDVAAGRALAGASERCFEIRYEALRQNPEHHLGRMLEWLGLEATRFELEDMVAACSLERLRRTGTLAPRGFFRTGRVAGWRTELSRRQIRTIEHLAGRQMLEIGYELTSPWPVRAPLGLRVRLAAESARTRFATWAWRDRGVVRRGAARALQPFPALRRVLLQRLKRPA
jgi:hypothetical protein